jgi:chromatin remodeling complex protein RSC6
MEKINFGFEIASTQDSFNKRNTSSILTDKSLKEVFGSKSFETSWAFIETLA